METLGSWINAYALVLSIIGVFFSTSKLRNLWRFRHLRKVWGIKNGDSVIVVCSELDEPDERQRVEPREFIYNLKYGDVDAYFEVVTTLLRLYPAIKLRVMSAGEVESTRVDLARHMILIGGPDYNAMTERVLKRRITQFEYRSPDCATRSTQWPNEIVLYDKTRKKELCQIDECLDFGYFERIVNPHNPDSRIVLVGGCHTIGVTGAVKAFSMSESEDGDLSRRVLANAALVSKRVGRSTSFSVLVSVERVAQSISVPVVRCEDVTIGNAIP